MFTNVPSDIFYYGIAPYRSLLDLYLERNYSKGSMSAYLSALRNAPEKEIEQVMIDHDDPLATQELLRRNPEYLESIYEDAFGYGLPTVVRFLLLNYPNVDLATLIGSVDSSYSSNIGEDLYLRVRSLLLPFWNRINDESSNDVVISIQRSIIQANRGSDTLSQNPDDYPLYLRDILSVVRRYPNLAQQLWMGDLPADL